jgi:acyl carrier protein
MTEQEIIDKVNGVFIRAFEIDEAEIRPGAHIFEDLGLDSLDIVDLVVELQKAFGVKIREEEEVREIRTLNDIYEFIKGVKAGKGGS